MGTATQFYKLHLTVYQSTAVRNSSSAVAAFLPQSVVLREGWPPFTRAGGQCAKSVVWRGVQTNSMGYAKHGNLWATAWQQQRSSCTSEGRDCWLTLQIISHLNKEASLFVETTINEVNSGAALATKIRKSHPSTTTSSNMTAKNMQMNTDCGTSTPGPFLSSLVAAKVASLMISHAAGN